MANHRGAERRQENYLGTVSDLMAALLFVFLIALVTFILTFQEETNIREQERKNLEATLEALTNTSALRAALLREIKQKLESAGVQVEIVEEHGLLRLGEDAITFRSGSAELGEAELLRLTKLQTVLAEVLPCYGKNALAGCVSTQVGKLESVLIEGHTDNVPLRGGEFESNFDLSAARALSVYQNVINRGTPAGRALMAIRNEQSLTVFGVAGYGEDRPLPGRAYEAPTNDARNRRIDIRFIMQTPESEKQGAAELIEQTKTGLK